MPKEKTNKTTANTKASNKSAANKATSDSKSKSTAKKTPAQQELTMAQKAAKMNKNASSSNKDTTKKKSESEELKSMGLTDCIKYGILANKYTKYILSDKGKAVLFVQKHLKKANKNVWIEILEIDAPKYYEIGYAQFKTVVCALYPKTIKPAYPSKRQYPDKNDYKMICEAIDWDAAQKDIKTQKRRGVKPEIYRIEGVVIINTKDRPPMFIKSAPDNVKALANDIKDKSSSTWEVAYKYMNPEFMNYDEYQYKIKKIERIE